MFSWIERFAVKWQADRAADDIQRVIDKIIWAQRNWHWLDEEAKNDLARARQYAERAYVRYLDLSRGEE